MEFPFNPWLKKLCINCCLQYKRKYFKKHSLFELHDSYKNIESIDLAMPEVEDKDYMQLLSKLPQACKTVLNLYVIEEYKHQEIADLLGISIGTSKSNLARAKRLLFKMLEKDSRSKLKLKSNLDG
jgi:RNA polymerase sigma-70 factor (ECF subfamily)